MSEQVSNKVASDKAVTAGLSPMLMRVLGDIATTVTPLIRKFGYRELPDIAVHRRWVRQRVDAYTYFAEGEWTGRIKIGRSVDPWRRVPELFHSANGEPGRLLIAIPCEAAEGFYHREFAKHADGNEWFSPVPEILAEIERLKAHPERGEG